MRNVFALVFAAVGVGGAVVMFTLKTAHRDTAGFIGTTTHVHPAWATAVGIGFLIVGVGLAAATALIGKQGAAQSR